MVLIFPRHGKSGNLRFRMATHQIWSALTPAQAHEALCNVQDNNKKIYRSALDLLAPHMRLRVPKVLEMPKVERHALWQQILSQPLMENLSFNLLSCWLVATQQPLLCAWLDAVGIAHDARGYFERGLETEPDTARLQGAIDQLLSKFDPKQVAIYLRVFNQIDSIQWNNLEKVLETDIRLKL